MFWGIIVIPLLILKRVMYINIMTSVSSPKYIQYEGNAHLPHDEYYVMRPNKLIYGANSDTKHKKKLNVNTITLFGGVGAFTIAATTIGIITLGGTYVPTMKYVEEHITAHQFSTALYAEFDRDCELSVRIVGSEYDEHFYLTCTDSVHGDEVAPFYSYLDVYTRDLSPSTEYTLEAYTTTNEVFFTHDFITTAFYTPDITLSSSSYVTANEIHYEYDVTYSQEFEVEIKVKDTEDIQYFFMPYPPTSEDKIRGIFNGLQADTEYTLEFIIDTVVVREDMFKTLTA